MAHGLAQGNRVPEQGAGSRFPEEAYVISVAFIHASQDDHRGEDQQCRSDDADIEGVDTRGTAPETEHQLRERAGGPAAERKGGGDPAQQDEDIGTVRETQSRWRRCVELPELDVADKDVDEAEASNRIDGCEACRHRGRSRD